MQDQQMMRRLFVVFWSPFVEFLFHFKHGLARCEAGAVGDPEDMCVNSDSWLPERGVKYDIRRFSADSRQGF